MVEVKGFPDVFSEKLDVPDIAELLMYPMFNVAEADFVYKHGTDFHRYLLDNTPIRNTRKHVTVFSMAQIITPLHRSVSSFDKLKVNEWHIDGENDDGLDKGHEVEGDIVHLLLSHTSATTQFNTHSFDVPNSDGMNRKEFSDLVKREYMGRIIPKSIETDKIYTFTNHFHRAVPANRLEFRYTFRVRETDKDYLSDDVTTQVMYENKVKFLENGLIPKEVVNLYQENETKSVVLNYPDGVWNYHHRKVQKFLEEHTLEDGKL